MFVCGVTILARCAGVQMVENCAVLQITVLINSFKQLSFGLSYVGDVWVSQTRKLVNDVGLEQI